MFIHLSTAILCTIHQPSSLLFESFGESWENIRAYSRLNCSFKDRLLLLERGGETVYFGDIGPDSRILREYFSRYGAECPPDVNPAEFMLEAIGAGVTPRIGDRDWKDVWLDSPEYRQAKEEILFLKNQALKKPISDRKKLSTCECHFERLWTSSI